MLKLCKLSLTSICIVLWFSLIVRAESEGFLERATYQTQVEIAHPENNLLAVTLLQTALT
jgi:hypothetical protein